MEFPDSLLFSPYDPLLLASPLDYNQRLHGALVVDQHSYMIMKESIKKNLAHKFFNNFTCNSLNTLFVFIGWFESSMVDNRRATILWLLILEFVQDSPLYSCVVTL